MIHFKLSILLAALFLVPNFSSAQIFKRSKAVIPDPALITLCQKSGLLPREFPLSEVQKTITVQNQVLLVLNNHESLASEFDDPYANLFLSVDKNKIVAHHWQYATEIDDADLTLAEGIPVFSYYSSPVGYTEYFFLGREVLKTHKLDEGEEMDWAKLDLEKQTYRVLNSKERFVMQKTTPETP